MIGWDEYYELQHGDGCSCDGCDGTAKRIQDRADTLVDLEAQIGPRLPLASVLRAMRMRRGKR